jgi:spore coat protein H
MNRWAPEFRRRSLWAMITVIGLQASCITNVPEESSSTDWKSTVVIAENGRPVGWTEETHSKDGTADYAVVFPQGRVNRIDITITASDWQAMLDDMTNLYGQFGQGGRGGFDNPGDQGADNVPPAIPTDASPTAPDMTNTCEGMQEGDACTISFNGTSTQGTCTALADGQLMCRPQMNHGVLPDGGMNVTPPTEMVAACSALQEGDACNLSLNGIAMEGTCTATGDGQLACTTQMGPGEGAGNLPGGGGNMLGDNGTNPLVVPCMVAFEGKTWWYVGIRFKGNSSLMSTWSSGIYKLPFRLDYDAFEDEHPEVDNQRFFGFEKLSLASNWSDPSCLREKIGHDIFRAAGVPAPYTAFCRLYIDFGQGPTYFGLYTITEIPDDPMFERQFGDTSGNLYKPTSNWVSFSQDDFEKQSNEDEADWSDVEAAIAALHADRTDVAAWRAGLEATFDVDGFLRWLAVNTVIQNWDTYGQMAHNYYLYGYPNDNGRLHWIPWDNNMAFMAGMGGGAGGNMRGGLSLELSEVGEQWPLIRFLMDDSVYRAAYVSYVKAFVEQVWDVASVQARFQTEHDLIAPCVVGTEGEQPGYTLLNDPQEFDTELDTLLDHVVQRYEAALAFPGTGQ